MLRDYKKQKDQARPQEEETPQEQLAPLQEVEPKGKICKICGIDKPRDAFSIAKRTKAGEPIYRAECKECFNHKQNSKKNNFK